jgi:hypothetical protein
MACLLEPDPKPNRDVTGKTGTRPKVFITSDASPHATVIAGTLDDVAVDVANKVFMLPTLKAGVNVLNLVIEGIAEGDDVQLCEDCGGGATKPLKKKFAGGAAGGGNPLVGFRIRAS